MTAAVTNLRLAEVVLAPLPDHIDVRITVRARSIDAVINGDAALWQEAIDAIGNAHGGTPWTIHGLTASHKFDGITVTVQAAP